MDGEGARLFGGRWNSPGTPVVYTANSLALAVVETRVHLRTPPADYVRLTIEIPNARVTPVELLADQLDPAWRSETSITRALGDAHFQQRPDTPLKVPSVVVDTEWNLLFHPVWAAAHAVVVEQAPITFDLRLWN